MDTVRHVVALSPQYLIPSWKEVNMTIVTAVLLVALFLLLQSIGQQQEFGSGRKVGVGLPLKEHVGSGKQKKKANGAHEEPTTGRQQVRIKNVHGVAPISEGSCTFVYIHLLRLLSAS